MYLTTKPTTYLIDGCNMVRSFLYEFSRTEDEVTADFIDFLCDISSLEHYAMHEYHIIFDGPFRPVGPRYRAGVHIDFAENDTADQIIYEKASYWHSTGKRVIVVTDDRELQNLLKQEGVKTLFCQKFYRSLKTFEK